MSRKQQSAVPAEITENELFIGREWALNAVAMWLSGTGRVLLIEAEPGGGKTAFAARLMRSCSDGRLAAVHFCQQRRQESLSAVQILENLASQLAESVPGYAHRLVGSRHREIFLKIEARQKVRSMVNSTLTGVHLALGEIEPRQAFDEVLRAPLKRLQEDGSLANSVVVLIDALDETVEGAQGVTWAQLLASEMGRDPPPALRLIATSRPGFAAAQLSHYVGSHLQSLNLLDDEPPDVDDVAAYARHRLRAAPASGRNTLAERIAESGKGNFLYAKYVLDDILGRHPMPVDLAELPLPRGLTNVYRDFMSRAIYAAPDAWQQRFRPLLAALVESQGDGLTRAELVFITGIRERELDDTLHVCRPYMHITPEGAMRPYHQSLRDFFRQPGDLHIYPRHTHAEIAEHLIAAHQERWVDSPYLVEHLATHVAAACAPGQSAEPGVQRLAVRLTDPAFIQARTALAGIDALLSDYARVLAAMSYPPPELSAVYRLVRRQAHHLRKWNKDAEQGFLLQQLLYEAVAGGHRDLVHVIAAYLDEERLPHLRAVWATSSDSSCLTHTLAGAGAVAITPDGSRAVTASGDGTGRVWNLATGQELHTLTGHTKGVVAVAITPDGTRAVTASGDGTGRVWDLATGQELHTLAGHQGWVRSVAVTPDGTRAVTASGDGTGRVWNLATGQELHTLTGHTKGVVAVAITPDGTRAVTASGDGTGRVWDLATGQELHTLTHGYDLEAVAVTPESGRAITSSLNGTGKVWDLATGQELRTLVGHHFTADYVAVSPDGTCAITASRDRTARVWDLATGQNLHILAHADWVEAVAITPDGTRVITASQDRTAKVWDLATGQELHTLRGHAQGVYAVAIAPDGTRAVTASGDGTARVWDLAEEQAHYSVSHSKPVSAVAAVPHGTQIVTGSSDGTARVWDLATGEMIHTLAHGTNGYVSALASSGTHVITAYHEFSTQVWGDADRVHIWDLATGQEQCILTGHTDVVNAAAVTPDGTHAITVSRDETARVWDLATRKAVHILQAHTSNVITVAVTPDGSRAVTGSADGTARVWDLATGEELHTLAKHAGLIYAVAVTPDGSRAITASIDRAARVWDLATGQELHTLRGHTSAVHAVAVTPDGTRAVTASWDGTGRVWSLATGRELYTLIGHAQDSRVNAVVVTPDGANAVTISWDATARLWSLGDGQQILQFTPRHIIECIAVASGERPTILCGTQGGDLLCLEPRL